jgi:hypothetical protein
LLSDIAEQLGVAKSSVSMWVRDVPFDPPPRRSSPDRKPHPQHVAKLAEIAACESAAFERVGVLSEQAFFAAGVALYAGEGTKRDGGVEFANADPAIIAFFCRWLRECFTIDERRLRVRVYLHADLDLDAAEAFWSEVTGVPRSQFRSSYRAKADATMRNRRHEHGCAYVRYGCVHTHRQIMGAVRALLTSLPRLPG